MNYVKTYENFLNEGSSLLSSTKVYDVHFPGRDSSKGWKLSILGKSLKDSNYLWDKLHDYLVKNDIAHKFGTLKRIEHPNKIQSKKLVTIYVPNDISVETLAPKIEKLLIGYKGWHDIKTPPKYEHYSNGIFFRNDRDESGDYIKSY